MRAIHASVLFLLIGCGSTDPTKKAAATNADPTIEIVSPMYGYTVSTDSGVDFLATVDDEETTPTALRVSWNSDIDGDLHADSSDEDGNAAFEAESLSIGSHTITATVTDTDGGSALATTLLAVIEPGESPVVALLSPSSDEDEQGVSGEPLQLEAVVEDDDDMLQDLTVEFEIISDEQNTGCLDEPDEDGVAGCEVTLAEGLVFIRVTATDPMGQTGTDELADFRIVPAEEHDGDGDGYSENDGDCDDDNTTVHPEAPEIVDDIDNNCNGDVDEDTDTSDDDGDGLTELEGDCDDTDDTIFTGATEHLNGVDDDCDGTIDEGTIAFDDDGDCYCEGGDDGEGCTGSVSETCLDLVSPGDCNDGDEDVYPYAPEIVDLIDNDCDGSIDETTDSSDDDGDGFSELDGDCNDDNAAIYPGAPEALNDLDDDCDGTIDEGTDAYDDDGDCYCEGGGPVTVCRGSTSSECDGLIEDGDCNDGDEDINPGAIETCDGEDLDCDGLTGASDPDTDTDGDTYSRCEDIDCNDFDPDIHPGATEYCNDTDDDCNGVLDDDYATGASIWYFDGDGDDFGSMIVSTYACDSTAGYIPLSGDCDDSDPNINPGETEVCDDDDTDEDCDGSADGTDAIGKSYWYLDADDDGFATDAGIYSYACDAGWGYIAGPDDGMWDCDDARDWIHPGATEVCDEFGYDEDCDGTVDEPGATGGVLFYKDWDGDTYGDPDSPAIRLCPGGDAEGYEDYVTNSTDCCDIDDWVYPGRDEATSWESFCGGWDYDCDGEETKTHTSSGDCSFTCGTTQGWTGSVAACGDSATWLYDCDIGLAWDLCTEDRGAKTQTCL
jgi:hypothetical protein